MSKRKVFTEEECFRLWVSLGEKRTIPQVAEVTGKSPKTLYDYSSRGKWADKLARMEEEDKSLVEAIVRDSRIGKVLSENEIIQAIDSRLRELLLDSLPNLGAAENISEFKKILETRNLNLGKATTISREEVVTVNTDSLSTEELLGIGEDVASRLFGEMN